MSHIARVRQRCGIPRAASSRVAPCAPREHACSSHVTWPRCSDNAHSGRVMPGVPGGAASCRESGPTKDTVQLPSPRGGARRRPPRARHRHNHRIGHLKISASRGGLARVKSSRAEPTVAATRLSPCRTPLACRPCRPQRTATRRHVVVPVIIRVHLTCRGLRGPTGAGKGEQRGPPPLPPCGACSPITAEQRGKERREKRGSVIAQPRFRRRVAVGRRPCLPPYGRRWSPASARCVGGSPREGGGQSSARRRPPAARPTRTGVGAGEGRTELCAQLCATCLPNPTTISGSAEKEIYNEQRKGEARRGAGAGRRAGGGGGERTATCRRQGHSHGPLAWPRAATGSHGQARASGPRRASARAGLRMAAAGSPRGG